MRYAYVMGSGAGKTYLTINYDRIYDIEKGMWYAHINWESLGVKDKDDTALAEYKVGLLEDFLSVTYPFREPDIILLVHSELEVDLLNAELVDKFSIDLPTLEIIIAQRKERSYRPTDRPDFDWMEKTMRINWEYCSEERGFKEKTHLEIEREVMKLWSNLLD